MKTFLSGLAALFAGNLLSLVLGFVFTIILIEKLSPSDYGLQSALVALAGITMSLADLGMFDIAARELARQPREKLAETFSSLLGLRLALSAVVCAVVTGVTLIPNSFPGRQFAIFLLALFTLVFSFAPTSTIEALLSAAGRTRTIALLQSIYNIGTVALGLLVLALGGDLNALYLAFSALSLAVIVIYWRAARAVLPEGIGLAFRPRQWRYFLAQTISGGLGMTFVVFCLRFGTYWVYTFVSHERAGYIGLSSQLYQAMIVLIWAPYAISILPVLTRLHGQSPEQLKWLSSRSVTWLMTAVLPITVGGALLAPVLLDLLKPGEGTVLAPIMQILIWLLPLDILQSFSYRMLLVMGKQHYYLRAAFIAAVVNVALCLLLIPLYDVEGAALASVAAIGLLVVIELWHLRQWLLPQLRVLDVIRIGVALAAMAAVVQFGADWFFLWRIALGAVVYGGLLLALRLFRLADWATTHQLLLQK